MTVIANESESVVEFALRAVIAGIVFGVLFGAANADLGYASDSRSRCRFRSPLPLTQRLRGRDHLFRTRPNAKIPGQVHPAHRPRSIDEKLSGSRDVLSILAAAFVEQVVSADDFRLWIGKERIRVPGLLSQIRRLLRRIDADRDGPYTHRFELTETLLDTP